MQQIFIDLENKRALAEAELIAVNKAIEALQHICIHQWEVDQFTPHGRWDKCKECGLTKKD